MKKPIVLIIFVTIIIITIIHQHHEFQNKYSPKILEQIKRNPGLLISSSNRLAFRRKA